jgi:hypothetical protein
MKLSLIISILLVGCCNLPLVDCGPKIVKLKVTPNKIQLDTIRGVSLNLTGWQYDERRENTPTLLKLDFETVFNSSGYIVIFQNAKIKIDNIEKKNFDYINTIEKININNNTTSGFYQFKNCCTSYPITINFDSIPIVNGSDTIYKNFKIEVSKLK